MKIHLNLILLVFAVGAVSCKKGAGVEIDDNSGLSSVVISKPDVASDELIATATVSIECLNCEVSDKPGVDQSIELSEKTPVDQLESQLESYQFTEGRQIKIDLKYFNAAEENAFATCEGDSTGCVDYIHTLSLNDEGKFSVVVKLVDLTQPTEVEDPFSPNVTLTSDPLLALDLVDGHCIVDHDGKGDHVGTKIGEDCHIPYGASVLAKTEGIQYIAEDDTKIFSFINKDLLLEEELVIVGYEERDGLLAGELKKYPTYLCKVGERMGKTSRDPNGELWSDCHISTDVAGALSTSAVMLPNYELLSFEEAAEELVDEAI